MKTPRSFTVLKIAIAIAANQHTVTAIFILLWVTTFEYCIANLIAMSLSKVTNIRWRHETISNTDMTSIWKPSTVSLLLRLNNSNNLHRIYKDWPKRPVNASVTAKQASKMLLLVWSRGLVFTAFITRTLSRTVKGTLMLLMMIMIMWPASHEKFAVLAIAGAFVASVLRLWSTHFYLECTC